MPLKWKKVPFRVPLSLTYESAEFDALSVKEKHSHIQCPIGCTACEKNMAKCHMGSLYVRKNIVPFQ